MPSIPNKSKALVGKELYTKDLVGRRFLSDSFETNAPAPVFSSMGATGTQSGGTHTFHKIQTDKAGSRFYADKDNVYIYDDDGNVIFRSIMTGTDVGDVIIGDFAGGAGIKYDKSAGTFTVLGTVNISELHIPDQDSTANSFHVNTSGDAWWGATETNFNADNNNATAYVLKTGVAKFQNVSLTNNVTITDLQSGSALTIQGWTYDGVLSVTDADTVAWASGTLTVGSGETFSITGSNTGNMVAKTYIYFDKAASTTAFQTSTTRSDAIGLNKILIAVAENGTGEATFFKFGDDEANLDGSNIVASSITANEIATNTITANEIASNTITASEISAGTITATEIASNTITASQIAAGTITATEMSVSQLSAIAADLGTITAGTITGGTLRTAASGARVVMDSTGIKGYDATTQRFQLLNDGSGWFGSSGGLAWNTAGVLTADALTLQTGSTIGGTDAATVESNANDAWVQIGEAVAGGAVSSMTISSISARQELRILVEINGSSTGQNIQLTFNNDTTSNYRASAATTGFTSGDTTSRTSIHLMDSAYTLTNGHWALDVVNIASRIKVVTGHGSFFTSATNQRGNLNTGAWMNTADQITRVDITASTGTFAAGSRVTVYAKKD